jgi:PAS domain S-box-containing protein
MYMDDQLAGAHFAAIINSADDAIISKTLEGIVTSWNRAAERLFGYTAAEMIGKSLSILIPKDSASEETDTMSAIADGKSVNHYDARRMRKDGTIIDVSVTVSPIRSDDGGILGASEIAREAAERKRLQIAEQAQRFLGAIVESAEDAIISKTLDGTITTWNRGAQRIFGYTAAEAIGKPVTMLIPEGQLNEEPQIIDRLKRRERIEHYETKRKRKDGSLVDISLTVSPIIDGKGNVIGGSKVARDITESKRSQRRERKALEQAEIASRMKDEFIATMSHELRTPLTAVLGWVRMLVAGNLDGEAQKKALQVIERNVKSQAQLIEDLLDMSRIMTGKLRLNVKPVDPATIVTDAVEAIRPAAEAKNIRVHTILDSSAHPISGDADRLQQVVWNLLVNAIKFTPRGGQIGVTLERISSHVELSVTDTGIGIQPEFLPNMFNRFTQADASITRSHGGLGVGLAIVRYIVELHGGTVTAFSAGEGQGSTFTLAFPLSAARPRRTPLEETHPTYESAETIKQLSGLKILVIDDERDTLEMLKFMFEDSGAVVQMASSAPEGLQALEQWSPDVIVCDIGMPDIDGYELIRRVRKGKRSNTPAVALTALVRIEDRVKALSAGYQMHVAKPVEPLELITIVASLAGKH